MSDAIHEERLVALSAFPRAVEYFGFTKFAALVLCLGATLHLACKRPLQSARDCRAERQNIDSGTTAT